MKSFLDFERPVADLESKIAELRALDSKSSGSDVNFKDEIATLTKKVETTLTSVYGKLTPWQKTQVARHPLRPHFSDIVKALVTDFTPLAGDRNFSDDHAILGGLGRFKGRSVVLMGHEKGRDTTSRIHHNFGMARPEGYRKAVRLMDMADRFGLPLVTFVDTSGAYPGVGAEERGQAEAIAKSTARCLDLTVPMVSAIVGEGGSGGAIALAAANRVIMLEHSVYSVISPEGCASILWHTADKAEEAATQLKLTAQDLATHQVIDEIVPEPVGGAHRDIGETIDRLGRVVDEHLHELAQFSPDALRADREERFLKIGLLDAA